MQYTLVSADDHLDLNYTPADLWQQRLPARYRDIGPEVVERPEGRMWMWEGEPRGLSGRRRGQLTVGALERAGVPDEPEPGVFRPSSPKYRVQDMDHDGVDAHVIYGPDAVLALAFKDPELKAACLQAYNSWLAEEFCAAAPERIIGLAFLPVHDPQAATAELYRVAGLGLRGTVFNVWDCATPVYDAAWEPLWAAAHETGLPISYHIGGRGGLVRPDAHPAEVAAVVSTLPMALGRPVAETIFSGVFERHPHLTLVVAEAGLGWVAYLLDRMDREYEDKGMSRTLKLSAKPSEIFRQHMYISFQEEAEGGLRRIVELGVDNVIWASDYPHPDSCWPHSRALVDTHLGLLGEEVKRKVTCDNAVRLYRLA
jgi:predicted TIM-barrel fold metal-dependent hydrolase